MFLEEGPIPIGCGHSSIGIRQDVSSDIFAKDLFFIGVRSLDICDFDKSVTCQLALVVLCNFDKCTLPACPGRSHGGLVIFCFNISY